MKSVNVAMKLRAMHRSGKTLAEHMGDTVKWAVEEMGLADSDERYLLLAPCPGMPFRWEILALTFEEFRERVAMPMLLVALERAGEE